MCPEAVSLYRVCARNESAHNKDRLLALWRNRVPCCKSSGSYQSMIVHKITWQLHCKVCRLTGHTCVQNEVSPFFTTIDARPHKDMPTSLQSTKSTGCHLLLQATKSRKSMSRCMRVASEGGEVLRYRLIHGGQSISPATRLVRSQDVRHRIRCYQANLDRAA